MVSWGTSFYKGFVILLWCIVWAIIGGVVAAILGLGSLWVNLSQPDFWQALLRNPQYILTILTESLIGFLIGGIIAFIGQFASFFKVTVDGAAGEMKKLESEMTNLKDEITREIAKKPAKIDEAVKDLEKRITQVKNETTEEIAKTRKLLTQLNAWKRDQGNLFYDEGLEKLKISLATDIAQRIVDEVNRNIKRERDLSHLSEDGVRE